MRRRTWLALPVALSGCGGLLSERAYVPTREWPLLVTRPGVSPPPPGAPVLAVRSLRAAPGLEVRGLPTLARDGSLTRASYEEWLVPPGEGVEDALRRWLAASGLYSAVLAPGSRVIADQILEGELTALWIDERDGLAHAGIGLVVLAGGEQQRLILQQTLAATAPASGTDAADAVAALRQALARLFSGVETALRAAESRNFVTPRARM